MSAANWLLRLVGRLVCAITARHVQRWSPDDADDFCRRCGAELFPVCHRCRGIGWTVGYRMQAFTCTGCGGSGRRSANSSIERT